jgi:hypothetical protein
MGQQRPAHKSMIGLEETARRKQNEGKSELVLGHVAGVHDEGWSLQRHG